MRKKILRVFAAVFTLSAIMQTASFSIFAETKTLLLEKGEKVFDAPQKIINNTVYVPLRPVLEALGWSLTWNPTDRTISCTKESRLFVLKAGSNEVSIDDKLMILEKPVVVEGGITYIPSKFAAQKFGAQIRWNGKDNLIILSDYDRDNISLEGERNIVIAGSGIIVNIFEPYREDTISDLISYADRLLGKNKAVDALKKYQEILLSICIDENPDIYAHVLINMGNAYSLLAETKDVKENIKCAIALYEKALKLHKKENAAKSYAHVLNNLGNAYRVLSEVTGDKNGMDRALDKYKEALGYYEEEVSLLDNALIHYNIGLAYRDLGLKDLSRASLWESACLYTKALKAYSMENNTHVYALIQYNLGNTYRALCETEETEMNLKKSKACYKEALKVWNVESYPFDYATVHKCMGDVYSIMYRIDGNKENLEQALIEYNESLKIFSPKLYPSQNEKVNTLIKDLYLEHDKGRTFSSLTYLFRALYLIIPNAKGCLK